MDWKPETIEAALRQHYGEDWRGSFEKANAIAVQEMRETLDAAIKAQGGMFMSVEQFAEKMSEAHGVGQINGYEEGRAEAFEEAAKKVQSEMQGAFVSYNIRCDDIVAAILALAKEPK